VHLSLNFQFLYIFDPVHPSLNFQFVYAFGPVHRSRKLLFLFVLDHVHRMLILSIAELEMHHLTPGVIALYQILNIAGRGICDHSITKYSLILLSISLYVRSNLLCGLCHKLWQQSLILFGFN
jgi:hypothetical protein